MEILTRFFDIRYTSEHDNLSWTGLRDYFGLVLPPSHLLFRFLSQLSQTSQEFFFALALLGGLFQQEAGFHLPKSSLVFPLKSIHFCQPSPGQSLTCIVTRDLPHLEFQINGIMLHIGFCAWLLSHSKLFGKCILGVDWTSHRVLISSSFEWGLLLLQINVL